MVGAGRTTPPRMVIAMAEGEEGFIGSAINAWPLPRMVITMAEGEETEEGHVLRRGRQRPKRAAVNPPRQRCPRRS